MCDKETDEADNVCSHALCFGKYTNIMYSLIMMVVNHQNKLPNIEKFGNSLYTWNDLLWKYITWYLHS